MKCWDWDLIRVKDLSVLGLTDESSRTSRSNGANLFGNKHKPGVLNIDAAIPVLSIE